MQPLAIALMGPTASGKTDLAVRLAQSLNGEVVSVDSALVYRGLNIGAAKPSAEEQCGIKHWMMDIEDPATPYSVAAFCGAATNCIRDIVARGKVPILAGGTMMYFKALLEGLSDMPETDQRIRDDIEQEAAEQGWPAVHAMLADVDPVSAARIHPNHSHRISRALEVWRSSGKPMSEWQSGFSGGLLNDYRWQQFELSVSDRGVLHQRIELRFERMLEHGLIDEVAALRDRGDLNKDLPAIRSVGYRQVWEYLDGEYDLPMLKFKGVVATRQLAKRQMTWLRSWQGLHRLDILENDKKLKNIAHLEQQCLNFCY